jgi:hypothetical protein
MHATAVPLPAHLSDQQKISVALHILGDVAATLDRRQTPEELITLLRHCVGMIEEARWGVQGPRRVGAA